MILSSERHPSAHRERVGIVRCFRARLACEPARAREIRVGRRVFSLSIDERDGKHRQVLRARIQRDGLLEECNRDATIPERQLLQGLAPHGVHEPGDTLENAFVQISGGALLAAPARLVSLLKEGLGGGIDRQQLTMSGGVELIVPLLGPRGGRLVPLLGPGGVERSGHAGEKERPTDRAIRHVVPPQESTSASA